MKIFSIALLNFLLFNRGFEQVIDDLLSKAKNFFKNLAKRRMPMFKANNKIFRKHKLIYPRLDWALG